MMPAWLQTVVVIAAVGVAAWFIVRQAIGALHGKKTHLSGCGSCKSCASEAPAPSPAKVQIFPAELLRKKR